MKESFPSDTRTEYLSGEVTPNARATIRRLRLDFGATLYSENDTVISAELGGSATVGDDYYDPDGGHRVLWGDSCVSNAAPHAKLRVTSDAAWDSSGSTKLFISRASLLSGGDSWAYSAVSSPIAIAGNTRLGVHPSSSTTLERYYLWFIKESDGRIVRYTVDYDGTYSIGSGVTSAIMTAIDDGAAVHPVSESESIIVGYDAPYMFVQYANWTGASMNVSDRWYVHLSNEDEMRWSDAHWSDAVESPDDSNKVVVAVNLSRWGSAQAIIYDKTSGVWSQPKEIMPSQEQWGNLKCLCSGLSIINNRIWAVTVRDPYASNDTLMAHHVAIMSSPTGENWRDEGYVTQSTIRGKLLYYSSEQYCYVAGNVSVSRAEATNKLGYDAASMKYSLDEVYDLSCNVSGPSSSPEIALKAMNVSDAISDSGLLESGNEVYVEIGTLNEDYGGINRALLVKPFRDRTANVDDISLLCTGKMSNIIGGNCYRPPAAKVFDGPYSIHSRFYYDNGNPRLTVRQVSGVWTADRIAALGRYVLHCEEYGISLLPHAFSSNSFIIRVAFQPRVSIEGIWFVFWYEDEDNFWQAGINNDSGTHKVEFWRKKDGSFCTSARVSSNAGALSVGEWYTMYLYVRPGEAKLYLNNSDSYDFSSPTASVTDTPFLLGGDSSITEYEELTEHHVGLKIDGFQGFEGAESTGDVESATYNTLTDTDATFTSTVLGQWVRCNEQDRQITQYTATEITINPGWSDVPGSGDEYGIYTESTRNGPGCYYKELWCCEAIVPHTVDDVIGSILELCGVSYVSPYGSTTVASTGGPGTIMSSVDVKYSSSKATTSLSMWGSTDTYTGESACSTLKLDVNASSCSIEAVESTASASPPYQTFTVQAVHPSMITIPGLGTSKIIRYQANHKLVVLSCDGHFLTAFPTWSYWTGGWVGKISVGTATTTEFRDVLDSFAWDANEPASSALSRLMQGRRAKIVEREDGTIAVSRFDTVLGDLGTYTTPVLQLVTGEDDSGLFSFVEMVGAEDRAFYVNPVAARKKLLYTRADNPTLETQYDSLVEAKKMTDLAYQRHMPGQVTLYVSDPAVEVEDQFTVDGSDYIVEGVTFSLGIQDGKPQAGARIIGRQAPTSINSGVYDTDEYDDGTEYT